PGRTTEAGSQRVAGVEARGGTRSLAGRSEPCAKNVLRPGMVGDPKSLGPAGGVAFGEHGVKSFWSLYKQYYLSLSRSCFGWRALWTRLATLCSSAPGGPFPVANHPSADSSLQSPHACGEAWSCRVARLGLAGRPQPPPIPRVRKRHNLLRAAMPEVGPYKPCD